jgi:DNA-binding LytR/AlgR family response regulator
MNILIVEDEPLAAEKITSYLHDLLPAAIVHGPVTNIDDGIQWFENNDEPNVVISDIMLADGLCFDIYNATNIKCPVIFTTAYDEYAIRAFEVNSVDYLLKPVSKEKLKQSLEKITDLSPDKKNDIDFNKLAELLQQTNRSYKSRFLVKIGQKIKAIPTNKISYFFTQDKLSFIVSHKGDKYPVDHTLEEIDAMLDPKFFFRINRKYIVHIDAVKEIHPYFKGRLKLQLNPDVKEDIVISSEKTPTFKSWLDQ